MNNMNNMNNVNNVNNMNSKKEQPKIVTPKAQDSHINIHKYEMEWKLCQKKQ